MTTTPAPHTPEQETIDKNEADDMLACGPVSHTEAREIAQRFIDGHFNNAGRERPRATIPANPRRDDDLRLISYIRQQQKSDPAAEIERLRVDLAREKQFHQEECDEIDECRKLLSAWDTSDRNYVCLIPELIDKVLADASVLADIVDAVRNCNEATHSDGCSEMCGCADDCPADPHRIFVAFDKVDASGALERCRGGKTI